MKLAQPIAIDLFAGAGGFGLGFKMAGFSVPLSVEVDAWACDTLRYNHTEYNQWHSDNLELIGPTSTPTDKDNEIIAQRVKLQYKVDQIYVLRQQKNTDREFRYEETYIKNPINPTVVQHLFNKIRNHLTRDWTGSIEQSIQRGWLIDE